MRLLSQDQLMNKIKILDTEKHNKGSSTWVYFKSGNKRLRNGKERC